MLIRGGGMLFASGKGRRALRRSWVSASLFAIVGLIPSCGNQTNSPETAANGDLGAAPVSLAQSKHVSPTGSYETLFAIPVPPAPGAPKLSLTYSSQTNSSYSGLGWDLSVGYPMAITRDVRF